MSDCQTWLTELMRLSLHESIEQFSGFGFKISLVDSTVITGTDSKMTGKLLYAFLLQRRWESKYGKEVFEIATENRQSSWESG